MTASAAVIGRRACAVLAVCSAVLHGVSLGHTTNIAVTALTATMLAMCLYCAHDLWARGTLRAWALVALMNLGMIAIHTPVSAAHHHGASSYAGPAQPLTVMTLATAVAAVEIVAAAAVLIYRTRTSRILDFVTARAAGAAQSRPSQRQPG